MVVCLFESMCGERGEGLVVDSMNFGDTAISKSATFLSHSVLRRHFVLSLCHSSTDILSPILFNLTEI